MARSVAAACMSDVAALLARLKLRSPVATSLAVAFPCWILTWFLLRSPPLQRLDCIFPTYSRPCFASLW